MITSTYLKLVKRFCIFLSPCLFSQLVVAAPYTNSVYRAGSNSYVNVFNYHGIANNSQTQTRLQDQ